MFGWFSKKSRVSEEEVVAAAEAALRSRAPDLEVQRNGTVLVITRGAVTGQWNLRDVVRAAGRDAGWREGVESLAEQFLENLAAIPVEEDGDDAYVVTLRTTESAPDVLDGEHLAKEVFPGVIAVLLRPLPDGRAAVLTRQAVNLADKPVDVILAKAALDELKQLNFDAFVSQLDGPVFTNGEPVDLAPALLFPQFWRTIAKGMKADVARLRVVVAAPTRAFWSVDDSPETLAKLRQLAATASQLEEHPLPPHVLAFDGERWTHAA